MGYPLQYSWASLVAQLVKESACSVGDLGPIPGLGRSSGKGNSYLLQCSGLENSMDCMEFMESQSQTWLSDFHFTSFSRKLKHSLVFPVFKLYIKPLLSENSPLCEIHPIRYMLF